MTYADIVLVASPSPTVHQLFEVAADFVRAHDARLSAVTYAWPRVSLLKEAFSAPSVSTPLQVRLCEDALETTLAIGAKVLADRQLNVEWCSGIADPNEVLAEHLLAADLAILGDGSDGSLASVDPCRLAERSGAPILRLGSRRTTLPFQRILVAWKDSREARQAVHEALPILRQAEEVLVLGVGDEVQSERLEQVAKHLVRHAVVAKPLHVSENGDGVCAQILRHAEANGYDLVVSGAYSRSRLSETILGGVTHGLQRNAEISWFLAR